MIWFYRVHYDIFICISIYEIGQQGEDEGVRRIKGHTGPDSNQGQQH